MSECRQMLDWLRYGVPRPCHHPRGPDCFCGTLLGFQAQKEHEGAIAALKQQHAEFLVSLSAQHDAEANAASQRLRTMTTKKDKAEAIVAERDVEIATLKQQLREAEEEWLRTIEQQNMRNEETIHKFDKIIETVHQRHVSLHRLRTANRS